MPRQAKGPRLYLRKRKGRQPVWCIRDGAQETSTGCGTAELERAEAALADYIGDKHEPRAGASDPRQVLIADALNLYSQNKAKDPSVQRPDVIAYTIDSLLEWWGEMYLAEIRKSTCLDYVVWRTGQGWKSISRKGARRKRVSAATARRDLETLRAAVNEYHAEHTLTAVPKVTLPARAPTRQRWLTRPEAAALLRAARRSKRRKHLARFILIGIYTGTRPGAILKLNWHQSPHGGWIDIEGGVIHRRGPLDPETRKRQPPSRIPRSLLPHLKRWRKADQEAKTNLVVHYYGREVGTRLKTVWATARTDAGLGRDVTPHVLRHTAATWQMHAGTDIWEAAGYLGMSPETLKDVYGHHHPDFQEQAANAY